MNVETLTLGEIAKVEELGKAPMSFLGNDEKPQGLLMAALAFVIKRREDLKFTFNDAMNLNADELSSIVGSDEDEDDDAEDSPKD